MRIEKREFLTEDWSLIESAINGNQVIADEIFQMCHSNKQNDITGDECIGGDGHGCYKYIYKWKYVASLSRGVHWEQTYTT